jgi:DNA repair protein RadC
MLVWINYKRYSALKNLSATKLKASERLQIKCSKDSFDVFMKHWDLDSIEHIEEFKLLLMNRSDLGLGIMAVSKGGLSGTVNDVRLILQGAIKAELLALLLAIIIQVLI